jgi:site-specific recombinase XerD
MPDAQLSLFQRKTFPATLSSLPMEITPPSQESTVWGTLPAYYAYLQSGGYSKYTPAQFVREVKHFGRFLADKKLKDITTQDIQQWIATLKKATMPKYSAKTLSTKLSAISNYFYWLVVDGVIAANPASGIHNTKIISPLPDILFEGECQQLLTAASADARSYLLILLLLETGIKKEELFSLRLTHFDFSNRYAPELWVKHTGKKVKKDRKLKMPQEVVPVFQDYVNTYHIADVLFPYTPRFVESLISEVASRSGVQKKVTAGILRDTYAVRCLKRGEGIDLVLKKVGLSESTWEDAKIKYLKLASRAL